MTLVTFEIPEETVQLADWLERQVVGRELRQLVIELKAILGDTAPQESLNSICGDQLPDVLARGLAALDPARLRRLLKSPQSLFALQEQIFVEGGDYWETVPRSEAHLQTVAARQPKLPAAVTPLKTPPRPFRLVWGAVGVIAAAACLFLAVSLRQPQPAAPTWGFDRPGVLSAQMSPKEYLDSLADAAGDWFKKRPADSPALAKRLTEFRHGCDTLLAAEHPQLAAKDRDWLKERCGVWAGKIDGHLADLKAGTKTLEQVQTDADATINALVKALRSRIA